MFLIKVQLWDKKCLNCEQPGIGELIFAYQLIYSIEPLDSEQLHNSEFYDSQRVY